MTAQTEPPDLRRHLARLERRVELLERNLRVKAATLRPKPPADALAVTLWRNTNQGIPHVTDTAVSFTTALEDNDGMWNVATPTVFTIRTKGYWHLWALGKWDSDSTGQRSLHITVTRDGVTTIVADIHDIPDGSSFGIIGQVVARPRRMLVGDTVSLTALQQTTAPFGPQTLNLLTATDYTPLLGAVRLGP